MLHRVYLRAHVYHTLLIFHIFFRGDECSLFCDHGPPCIIVTRLERLVECMEDSASSAQNLNC